jgi:hypothetical protein
VEGRDRSLIKVPSLKGLRKTIKTSVRIAGVLSEIRTEYLPNTSLECANQLSASLVNWLAGRTQNVDVIGPRRGTRNLFAGVVCRHYTPSAPPSTERLIRTSCWCLWRISGWISKSLSVCSISVLVPQPAPRIVPAERKCPLWTPWSC